MRSFTTHRLTLVEERKLLKRLEKCKVLGRGSSRIVFEHPTNPNLVVKVAVGACSLRQNKAEVENFKRFGDAWLARIESYGRFCVVMERLTQICDEDNYDTYEDAQDYREAFEALTDMIGYTSDNYQLGWSNRGVVAYDYGFDPSIPAMKQCGWADCATSKTVLKYAHEILVRKEAPNALERYSEEIEAWN